MDINKAERFHGWRGFLKEYAIIVVGVLTALAAGQAVEAAHNRLEAADARDLIRGELEFDTARVRSRMDVWRCTARRIEELQALVDDAAEQPTIVPPLWIGRPTAWVFQYTRWQAAAQAGHAALIGSDELSSFGLVYARLQQLTLEMEAEQTDWAKLRTLEHVRRLEPLAAFDLNTTLQDARYRNWRIMLVGTQMHDAMKGLKLRNVANSTFASTTICFPTTTPRAEAERIGGRAFGEP